MGTDSPRDHSQHHEQQHSTEDRHAGHEDHAEHDGHQNHTGHEDKFRRLFWINSLLSIPVLTFSPTVQDFLGFSLPDFPGADWITPVFAVIVFIVGGIPFIRMAVPEIRKRQPGMMTLISLAISVAFIYSIAAQAFSLGATFFWELVTLIDIMLLGHWIEMRSVRQASSALDELANLMPDTAERIREDGEAEEVPVSALEVGDRVLVRPGGSVPVDGKLVEGRSDLDESMITGESKPVAKSPGDEVIGGTINGDGSLRIEVTATGDQTALAGIMRLVEEAQQSKSETQLLADKAAGWLFYIAVGVAVLTAAAWLIAVGLDVQVVARVAAVLVIACPHALGLAIPLVVAITTSIGANNGILVRDRVSLEKVREIDTVIFDKTGTLTRGEFGVAGIAAVGDRSKDEVLALAAAVESDSEHTIAKGIRTAAEEGGLSVPEAANFEAIKGRGVQAEIESARVYVGGPAMLEKLGLTLPEELREFEQAASGKGQSVVHVIRQEVVLGSLALADVIREESRAVIERLHDKGLEVVMLTGDSQAVAGSVAEELNIDQFFAEVLPEEKDKMVRKLQEEGKRVAMVGDGVNDAPALTRADVGIAIGSGTDVAVESAGLILVKSNPMDVVRILALSHASHRKMVQNLFWAAGYNVIALPLAAGVLAPVGIVLSPAIGALLMSLSTVIVAVNAQLLRRQDLSEI